jgi:hypothetical protein
MKMKKIKIIPLMTLLLCLSFVQAQMDDPMMLDNPNMGNPMDDPMMDDPMLIDDRMDDPVLIDDRMDDPMMPDDLVMIGDSETGSMIINDEEYFEVDQEIVQQAFGDVSEEDMEDMCKQMVEAAAYRIYELETYVAQLEELVTENDLEIPAPPEDMKSIEDMMDMMGPMDDGIEAGDTLEMGEEEMQPQQKGFFGRVFGFLGFGGEPPAQGDLEEDPTLTDDLGDAPEECGDGVCDEFEEAGAALCPEDCE